MQIMQSEGVASWRRGRSWDWLLHPREGQLHKHYLLDLSMPFRKLRFVFVCLAFVLFQIFQLTDFLAITVREGEARWWIVGFKWSVGRAEGYGRWHGVWNWEVSYDDSVSDTLVPASFRSFYVKLIILITILYLLIQPEPFKATLN